jgi:hypothetical protein
MSSPSFRVRLPASEVAEGPSLWIENLNQAVLKATQGLGLNALLQGDCLALPYYALEPACPSRLVYELYGLEPGVYAYRTSEQMPGSRHTLAHANVVYLLTPPQAERFTSEDWVASNQPNGVDHMQAMAWRFSSMPFTFQYYPLCLPQTTVKALYAAFASHNKGNALKGLAQTGLAQTIGTQELGLTVSYTPEGAITIACYHQPKNKEHPLFTSSVTLIENTFTGQLAYLPSPADFILQRDCTLEEVEAIERVAIQLLLQGTNNMQARRFLQAGFLATPAPPSAVQQKAS